MLYIAGRENLNISRALGYSINALVDSPDADDKRFAKDYNLDQIETANGSDEIILKAGYDAVTILSGTSQTDLNNLLARAKRNGLDSLDGVQIERLLVYTGETYQASEGTTGQIDSLNARENRLNRLKTLKINSVPASALESDEALDKFIAQQGLLEPK